MAQRVAARDAALAARVVPVLDADPRPGDRVQGVGDVAGGEDAGGARLEVLVDQDPVVHREPGGLGERRPRRGPDADDDQVGVDPRAVRRLDRVDRAVPAVDGHDALVRHQPHAVMGVDVAEDRADLGPEHPLERHGGVGDERDLAAELADRRRDLGSDPAAPDHDDLRRRTRRVTEAVRIVERAQVPDPGEVATGDVEPRRLGSRRDDQPVEPHPSPAVQDDLVGRRVDRRDRRRPLQVDALLGVPRLRMDEDLVELALAAQVLLRQGRTDVGPMGLRAEQQHRCRRTRPCAAPRRPSPRPGRRPRSRSSRPCSWPSSVCCSPS